MAIVSCPLCAIKLIEKGRSVAERPFGRYLGLDNSRLDDALSHHSVSNAHETSNVSALNVVDVAVLLLTILNAHVIDVVHDGVRVCPGCR